jgi:HSP20 family protein
MKNEFKDFVNHIDMLNTINGGASLTSMVVDKKDDKLTVRMSAPTVEGDAYNLLLRGDQLIVYTTLSDDWLLDVTTDVNKMPLFARTIDLPPFVDREAIDAIYENGELHIVIPFTETDKAIKKIDIKHY